MVMESFLSEFGSVEFRPAELFPFRLKLLLGQLDSSNGRTFS